MSKELLMVICVFAGVMTGLVGAGEYSSSDVDTYRLALTRDGCAYIGSIGMSLERNDGLCAIETRFWPNKIGSGGIIVLGNDKRIEVSDVMLLAKEKLAINLSRTPGMKSKAKLGISLICVAGLLCAFGLFIGSRESKK